MSALPILQELGRQCILFGLNLLKYFFLANWYVWPFCSSDSVVLTLHQLALTQRVYSFPCPQQSLPKFLMVFRCPCILRNVVNYVMIQQLHQWDKQLITWMVATSNHWWSVGRVSKVQVLGMCVNSNFKATSNNKLLQTVVNLPSLKGGF